MQPPSACSATADDRARVRAVLSGVPGAFESLVRDHQGLCWHVIQRMVRHPEDTRELCQEAFLRVHRHLGQYRFDAPLKSWIAQVAYSVARRHLERRRIPLVESVDDDGTGLAERVAGDVDLLGTIADADCARHLHAAIESLPPLQRTLLTLYHFEELSIGEISHITGVAEGTIKSHLFRSRRTLHALLEPTIGAAA